MKQKIFLCLFVAAVIFSLILSYRSNYNIEKNADSGIATLLILEDNKAEGRNLNLLLLRFFPKEKYIKILFVNDNVSLYYKKRKTGSLKDVYYDKPDNLRTEFIINEIKKIFGDRLVVNNFIRTDISVFNSFLLYAIKQCCDYKQFPQESGEYLNKLVCFMDISENVLKNTDRKFIFKLLRFYKNNKNNIDTNISINNILAMYGFIKNNNKLCFADIPVIKKKQRLEFDSETTDKIISFLSFAESVQENKNIKVEVLNASSKSRLAAKAVDKLRNSGFDIFEWGILKRVYDKTVITDLINNRIYAEKVKNVLGCGKVLFRPQNREFADISVILGKDCTILDRLDKIYE